MSGKGIDLEIVEKSYIGDAHVTVPNCVRINGQEVLLPDDSKIVISEISSKDFITVTLTMFVGSLSIKAEDAPTGTLLDGTIVEA